VLLPIPKLFIIAALTQLLVLTGCSTESRQGAAQGAAAGAAVGAVGGMVSALVFGGDVGDAAARGAVWGGSTGAASGAMRGSQVAKQKEAAAARQQENALARLQREIGPDAFRGLEALTDCKHKVAIAYAESAQNDQQPAYSLAGYWLEVLALAEQGAESEARAKLPALMQRDSKLNSEDQAVILLDEALGELGDIRQEYGMPRNCG